MIIYTCPDYQHFFSPNVPAGVLCRGLTACQLWQTDCCIPLWGTAMSCFKNRWSGMKLSETRQTLYLRTVY